MKFREAKCDDVPKIVEMLSDDELGSKRESFSDPLPSFYYKAFENIEKDPNNQLIVVSENESVIGTLQITYIPYLTFKGGTRAQIEAVRVAKEYRGQGIGKKFFEWAIKQAKERDCHVVQLTTNKSRDKAKDFYDSLGFESTHEGMKLYLKQW